MIARATSHHPRRGTALIAVLWLIAILSMACMATIRVIQFDLEISGSKIHGSTARQLAEKGIALGSNPLVKRSDPLLHQRDPETGEGFDVSIVSEGARLNLNFLVMGEDKSLLRSLFIDWGLSLEESQALCDALADWVDADDQTALNGAETSYYEGIGRLNQPFNRPFYNLEEASLVRGMDRLEAVRPNWRDSFTLWSSGRLDINEAPAELIAAAAEVSVESANQIPERVKGPDGIRDTDDDTPFTSVNDALQAIGVDVQNRSDITGRFTANEATTRIESTGSTPGAVRRITLILRNRTGQPAILERTEAILPTP
ncbi:MAG: type II secretion system protein GspK [Luteolibacter sp.]